MKKPTKVVGARKQLKSQHAGKSDAALPEGHLAKLTDGAKTSPREKIVKSRANRKGANATLKFIDLFAGIGGIRLGFERSGAKCVFSSEWDADAGTTYEAHFGERPQGDITKIPNSAIPDHDILVGGFPCQAFSIIGGMKGFGDTRGTLFFEIERILKAKQPRAFLLENVRNLTAHDKGQTFKVILEHLKLLGYHVHWRVLNALDFNLPQKRERVIIVGFKDNHPFEWPTPRPLQKTLSQVLEPDDLVSEKHFASEKIRLSVEARLIGKKCPPKPWICHENKAGNISPLPYSCALRAGASYNYLLVNGYRRLTPRENLRLQGFPEDFPMVVADSAIRKQCGNSVPVAMIEAVAKQVVAALNEKPIRINGLPVAFCDGQLEVIFPKTA
jgi:DNA (cytosine-5)-methyltransferase 1